MLKKIVTPLELTLIVFLVLLTLFIVFLPAETPIRIYPPLPVP